MHTYTYKTASAASVSRLQSITANNGYSIKFDYVTNTVPTGSSTSKNWMTMSKVTLYNASVDYCAASADSCTFSQIWPFLTLNGVNSIADALGNVTTYTISSGKLTGIKRPGASTNNVTISYDSNGWVSSVTNNGVATTYTFEGYNLPKVMTVSQTGLGNRIIKSDEESKVLSDQNEAGKITTVEYYSTLTTPGYYYYGLPKTVTAPEGNKAEYEYDWRGNIIKTTLRSKDGTQTLVTEASYEPSGGTANPYGCLASVGKARCNKPLTTKDPKLNVTSYEYDNVHGGLTKVTSPAPTSTATPPQTRYSYTSTYYAQYKSSSGTLVNFTTPLTRLTKTSACQSSASCNNALDEAVSGTAYGTSNVLTTSVSKGAGNGSLTATTTFTYDNVGNQITVDGPLSGTADKTKVYYDVLRRTAGVVDPDPDEAEALKFRAKRYSYNADSQVIVYELGTANNQTDATMATFASLQQLTSTYDATSARKTQDILTAPSTTTTPTYQIVQYRYDILGRLECQTLRMNGSASPANACSQLSPAPAVPDRISRTTYDSGGRVSVQQSAYGVTTSNGFPATLQRNEITTSYTDNGRVASVTDAKGNKTTYEYDGFDRLSKTRYPMASAGGSSSETDYEQPTYDANGNVTNLRLRDGQNIVLTYDNLNRLTFKNLPGSEPDVTYAYDLLGRMTSASQSGNALSFTYDALSRNLKQTGPHGTFTSQYDLAGRRIRLDWPDTFYVVYDWNFANEMTFVRENGATSGVGVLAAYTYDNLGRRTEIARSNGTSTILGYNPGSQLTSLAQNLAGTANDQTLGFTFNPAGQMITRSSSNDGYAFSQQYNAGRSYTVNGLNQYVTAGSAQPTYDGRGNLVSSQGKSYSYSSENYMLSAPGLAMSYDPLGRLYQSAGTATARRAYDGMSLVVEYNGSNVMQRRYVPGPSMDEPVLWYEGSGTTDRRWYHSDERGSVISLSDGTGAVVAINRYDEWGNPQSSNVGAFQYTGQIWLSEAGLYYYKARMYDPRLGRFMQADPIGYGGGTNLYAYVRNDPLNLLDPLGRQSCGPQSGFGPCSNQGSTGLGQLDGGLLTATFDMSDDPPGSDYGASNLDFIWGGGLTSIVAPLQLPQKDEPENPAPYNSGTHYCGSQGFNVWEGNWGQSCYNHDNCYGSPGAIKEVCDLKLARDMTVECSGKAFVPAACLVPGAIYGLGLMLFGIPNPIFQPARDAYNNAQRDQ